MKKLLLYIFIALSTLPIAVRAADTYTLLEPLPCIEGTGTNCTQGNTVTEISLNGYIGYVFKFSIALAAFLAVIMIIWGGFEYMLSETPFGKSSGKDRVTNALVGLLGILASYLILATIDPRLVEISTDIPKIEFKNSQSVVDFQRQLSEDMTRLTTNAQLQNQQLQAQIVSNTSKLEGFKNKEETVGLEPDEKVEYETLKLQTNELKASQTKVIANGVMDNQIKTALDLMRDPNYADTGSAGTDLRKKVAQNLALIEKAYADYSPQLITANDIEGEKLLYLRKVFYTDEIKSNEAFLKKVDDWEFLKPAAANKIIAEQKAIYEKEIAASEEPLNQDEASGFVRDQSLEDLHISILQYRVSVLNTLLQRK